MLQKSRVKVLEDVQSDLGTFVVPSSDGDSEAGFFLAIFKILI